MASYNGYEVKRGDVYYVRFDKSYGAEMSVGRPVVVVSADGVDKSYSMFTCVFMTTTDCSSKQLGVSLTSTPKASWALCNQLYSFDECRIKDYMCTLTDEEMASIDEALALALGLKLYDPTVEAKKQAELENLKKQLDAAMAQVKTAVVEQQVSSDLYKRLYEKALEQLAELRLARDLNTAEPVVEEPVVQEEPLIEEPVIEEPEPEPELVDLNKCGLGDLTRLGFSMATAKMIVAARPYDCVEDLSGVPTVTRIAYQIVRDRVTVGDAPKPEPEVPVVETPKPPKTPKVKKININTASAVEIKEFTGMSMTAAYSITGNRKRNGLYSSVDQIVGLPRVDAKVLEKYGDKLEV